MERRAFLRRLGASAAFVLPVVTSFSMSSVSEAFGAVHATDGGPELGRHSAASNSTGGNGGHPTGLSTGQHPHHHHHHPNCNNDPNPNSGGSCGFSELA
jgi:hypothetical protein